MQLPLIPRNERSQHSVSRLRILAGLLGFTMMSTIACGDHTPPPVSRPDSAPSITQTAQPPPRIREAATPSEENRPPTPRAPKSMKKAFFERELAPLSPPVREVQKPAPREAAPRPTEALQSFEVQGDFGVVSGGLATGVKDRTPTGIGDRFTTETERIWAFIKVRNRLNPTHVTMVWKKNGKKIWSYELRVGKSSGWRTWSRKRVSQRDVGAWSVEVLDVEGKLLVTLPFTITSAPDGPEASAQSTGPHALLGAG